jgi:hypothetical protein
MQKSRSIALLSDAGLTVPSSWLVRLSELGGLPLTPRQLYYCRASPDATTKIAVYVAGSQIAEVLRSHSSGADEWLVQPQYDFSLGGALYADSTCTYIEGVQGSPFGLLRHGELLFADFTNGDYWQIATSQTREWTIRATELVSRAMSTPSPGVHLPELARNIREAVLASGVAGLLEWGHVDGRTLFLDQKPLASTGALADFLHQRILPTTWIDEEAALLEVPDMEVAGRVANSSPLRFSRGARLSHAVTHRCAAGFTNITFAGW